MSLDVFIRERKKQIEGKIPLSKIYKQNTFVDCEACDYVCSSTTNSSGFFCMLTDSDIPKEVVLLGCDKGKEDEIPF